MHVKCCVLSSISSTVPATYVMQSCYWSCPDTFVSSMKSQRWCTQKQLGKSAAQSIQAINPSLPIPPPSSPPRRGGCKHAHEWMHCIQQGCCSIIMHKQKQTIASSPQPWGQYYAADGSRDRDGTCNTAKQQSHTFSATQHCSSIHHPCLAC